MPDGEPGERRMWTEWQHARLLAHPAFEPAPLLSYGRYSGLERVQLRPGVPDHELRFQSPGYAVAAVSSYEAFADAKVAGAIDSAARFLVALPTPLAVLEYVRVEDTLRVEKAYESALLLDLAQICSSIPLDELAIQWDVCHEMVALEGLIDTPFDDPLTDLASRLRALGEAVPEGVDLGYHFCYGSWHDEHFVEPINAGHMVDLANGALSTIDRSVDFLHFPVPIERDDADYFAPFARLARYATTELYLGLVHVEDGIEGAQRRAAAAAPFVGDFGIAAECGLGRQEPDAMEPALRMHAAVAAAV
jgi:hypothetical protein